MPLIPDLGKHLLLPVVTAENNMVSNFAQRSVFKNEYLLLESVAGFLGGSFLGVGSSCGLSLALQTERNLLAVRGMYTRDRHCCLRILTWG